MKIKLIFIAIVLIISMSFLPCHGQDDPHRVLIKSSGFDMVAHIYTGSTESTRPTVILVPGWSDGEKDVLGLGSKMSQKGINVVVFTPRGWYESEGYSTFHNGLKDIKAVWKWSRQLENVERYGIDLERLILGGHSWGGGMSLAYAASDSSVHRVFSISGNDHGQFIRHYQQDKQYARMIEKGLASTKVPEGPVRFNLLESLRELAENQDIYGLIENASNLSSRSVLLIGGWEDKAVTVDHMLLPLYRALKDAGAEDVTFLVYHAGHGFRSVRDKLTHDLIEWINR